jgi:hypothetical protein
VVKHKQISQPPLTSYNENPSHSVLPIQPRTPDPINKSQSPSYLFADLYLNPYRQWIESPFARKTTHWHYHTS